MLLCKHCNKECKNDNSLRNHERLCKNNPDRNLDHIHRGQVKRTNSLRTRKDRGTFRNQWSDPNYELKDSTRKKLSDHSKSIVWSEEQKIKHSERMKKAVEAYPNSYTSSNRGRVKQFEYKGIKFQGTWELEFYKFCEEKNIAIERSNEWFEYEWNGIRKYFPDFYLPEKDLYIEVKGYETERDRAKWTAFPKRLKIIKKSDIIDIRKRTWTGL